MFVGVTSGGWYVACLGAWTNSWLVVSSHLLSSRGRVCLMKIKSCQNSTCVRHCLGSTGITMRDPPPPLNTGGEAPVRSKPGESWGNWVNRVVQGCFHKSLLLGPGTYVHIGPLVCQMIKCTPVASPDPNKKLLILCCQHWYPHLDVYINAMLYVIVKKTVFVEVVANKSLSVYK